MEGSVLEIMILQVLVRQASGNAEAALAILVEAVKLAAPEGYLRIFVDEGPKFAGLISKADCQAGMPRYLETLIRAFDSEMEQETVPMILSRRELEVLKSIAAGLSNEEIGKALFVSVSTVKGHNQRIFEKLGVKRRTEAVASAQDRGLI